MFNINQITRKNIQELVPYSSAREEFSGTANIWLDANENPFESNINRYPDPFQNELKEVVSSLKNINTKNIFIGNGSDEAIDLLFRAFCEPYKDKAYIFPPTYGMYKVSAKINNIEIIEIPLLENFELPEQEDIFKKIDTNGLLFICSPNNPTGNIYSLNKIKSIAKNYNGLVIVDEAYIDFSNHPSAISLIQEYPNIVVLQTMSKAYGLAGLRLGMAFANESIIQILNKIKPPYNINTLSQKVALDILKQPSKTRKQINTIIKEKNKLQEQLLSLDMVEKIYPSSANFLLVAFKNANYIYNELVNQGIIIRNRTQQIDKCLRITIGTSEQNACLIENLKKLK